MFVFKNIKLIKHYNINLGCIISRKKNMAFNSHKSLKGVKIIIIIIKGIKNNFKIPFLQLKNNILKRM